MRHLAMFVLVALATACTIGAPDDLETGSEEPEDYVVDPDDGKGDGVSATFDRHDVISDELFLDDGSMTVDEVQTFFEESPYNNRSWLADYTLDGVSAAQLVVDAARAQGIHPLMLLVRMQGEATLVSKTTRPTATRINAALGCGCPDGGGCSSAYRGFRNQLTCGAEVMRRWYDASVDGSGPWRMGVARRTLDPISVTPRSHATASIYAYTPWVMVGRGGSWLTWNVARKYVRYAEARGFLAD